MEKYVEVLSNILNIKLEDFDDIYLNQYFNLINQSDVFQVLNNNDKWFEVFNKIEKEYNIKKSQIIDSPIMKTNLLNLISSILNERDKEKKINLIPLIIYIDADNILCEYLLNQDFFDDLEDFIKLRLEKIIVKISTNSIDSDLSWEAASKKKYEEALITKNFQDIYDFVESLERSNKLNSSPFLHFLVFILFDLSFESLLKILNDTNDTITILFFIQNLNEYKKLKLAAKSNNYLLKLEALRECVKFKFDKISCLNFHKDERKFIQQIILSFSKNINIWKQFLMIYFEFPTRNPQLFEPLSKVLDKLSKKKLNLLIDSIKIEQHSNDDCRSAINSCFLKIEDTELRKMIFKRIFERWVEFIDKNNDVFLSLVLTDVVDIIIVYILEFCNQIENTEKIKVILESIEELDNFWFQDEMEQETYFYKQMSKLFVYGFAIVEYKLTALKSTIQNICNTNLLIKYEHKIGNTNTTLDWFNEILNKE